VREGRCGELAEQDAKVKKAGIRAFHHLANPGECDGSPGGRAWSSVVPLHSILYTR